MDTLTNRLLTPTAIPTAHLVVVHVMVDVPVHDALGSGAKTCESVTNPLHKMR